MNKWSYIQAEIRVLNPDIVCICETWVPDNNLIDSFAFDNYIPFADGRTSRRGEGVLLLINAKLQPHPVSCNKPIYDCIQCNVACVFIGSTVHKTLVACVYRPPNTTIAALQLLTQHFAQINEAADNRIILGDFNFPHFDWTNPSCTKRDGLGDIFQAALDDMGLFQCVTKPTYNNHILDLALLSDECRNLPLVTLSDPHQAVWLKLHLGMFPQEAGKHNVLSPKIDMKSINLQLVF